ncbi:TlpA family protein disulfide reductase [Flavobacterium sp. SM2513]|uniref:TlpA family protein disulfide reductase n=1 Tax=Flavobacterium sp. SM2513 TaxID=3424766 RepID=UPI003D80005B
MNSNNPKPAHKFGRFILKNGVSILMVVAIVAMLVSPDAKSWVLRQLMLTGIFNANIEHKSADVSNNSVVSFDFKDENGVLHTTKALKGKVVFINFWASWCGPCRAEFPSIETLYSKFKNNPAVYFLVINADEDISKAKTYLQKENFTIPFFQSNGAVPDAIYTGTLPTTVVLDKEGAIRFRHEGFANYASENFIKQIEELLKE